MPRPKGSTNPERIRTPFIDQVRESLADCTPEEAVVCRNLFAHHLAGFGAEPSREARVLMALDDADLACRAETGRPLTQTGEYKRFAPAGAPALSTVYDVFGSFPAALNVCAIATSPRALVHVAKKDGRPTGSRGRWSKLQRTQALAKAVEHNLGRKISERALRDFVAAHPTKLPSYDAILGLSAIADKGDKISLDTAHERAYALAAEQPTVYPRTASYRAARVAAGVDA